MFTRDLEKNIVMALQALKKIEMEHLKPEKEASCMDTTVLKNIDAIRKSLLNPNASHNFSLFYHAALIDKDPGAPIFAALHHKQPLTYSCEELASIKNINPSAAKLMEYAKFPDLAHSPRKNFKGF